MATRACRVCGEVRELTREQLKLLHKDLPFICSTRCLLKYILKIESYWNIARTPEWFAKVSRPERRVVTEGGSYCPHQKILFRSKYDREVSYWLMAKGIKFLYEPFQIKIGTTVYVPDFLLPEKGVLVEVKGVWMGRSKKKLTNFLQEYPNSPLVLIPWVLHTAIKKEARKKFQGLERMAEKKRVEYVEKTRRKGASSS